MDESSVKIIATALPSIVGLAAIIFAYLNNRELRKVQLETTVRKEWIYNVRNSLKTFIVESENYYDYEKREVTALDFEDFKKCVVSIKNTKTELQLLLNTNNSLEYNLLSNVFSLSNATSKEITGAKWSEIKFKVIASATTLFDSYK